AHGLQPPQQLEIPYHDDSVGNVVYSVNIFPLSGLRVAVVFSDVTKTKFYQHELEKNQEGLQILVEFALQLLNTNFDSFNLITNSYLAKLASIVKADRAYIFCRDSNGTTISCTHEWCAEGISPQIHNCKNCPIEFLDEVAEIDKLGPFGVEVELLPKDSPFRALLESQDIKNMINYPIRLNNKFVGLVGFDSVSHKRLFSPTDFNLLKIFGQIFFSAKARLQAEREIESLLADHKSLLRFSPTIVCKISPKGYIQSISENCHQHLAAPPSTFLGKHARHFLDRSTFRSCRIFLSSLLHPKDPNQHPLSTLDIQLKSKTNSWFRLVASAVRKPTHPSPDYFILNLRNITTEKNLQEKIKNLSL
ncbi:MAG: GAF domain-containing protein, partial [Chthoniobacterales bacterium]|nr:GAF domain-containing protein [Chthoniobacterales bacterium]